MYHLIKKSRNRVLLGLVDVTALMSPCIYVISVIILCLWLCWLGPWTCHLIDIDGYKSTRRWQHQVEGEGLVCFSFIFISKKASLELFLPSSVSHKSKACHMVIIIRHAGKMNYEPYGFDQGQFNTWDLKKVPWISIKIWILLSKKKGRLA